VKQEIKQNFENKLQLVLADLLKSLDDKIGSMRILHTSKGTLKSSQTIKETVRFISRGNKNLYQAIINHIKTLSLCYYPELEFDIQQLAKNTQIQFKTESLEKLKNIVNESMGSLRLIDRISDEIKQEMKNDLANFQNELNTVTLNLRAQNHKSKSKKVMGYFQNIILPILMLTFGMLFNKEEISDIRNIVLAILVPVILLVPIAINSYLQRFLK